MRQASSLRVFLGIGVLVLLCGSAGEVRAGRPGGGGGGGSTTDITTNVQVVDSANKLVGEVVGVVPSIPYPYPWVMLDPTLVNGDSSLLVRVTYDNIYGSAPLLFFDQAGCTGNAYLGPFQNNVVFSSDFVMVESSVFKVYKRLPNAIPLTPTSQLVRNPDSADVCNGSVGSGNYYPTVTVILNVTPPFTVMNP